MIPEFGSRLGLICVMILIQSCLAHPDLPKMGKLESAIDGGSSRPTWEMVREALGEWERWMGRPYLDERELDEKTLLRDSVLLPFKYGSGNVNEKDRFLDKLFLTYKLFWPYYVADKEVPGESVGTPSCNSFYEAVIDKEKRKQLTIEDFRNVAKKFGEYKLEVDDTVLKGELPYKRREVAKIYNTVTKYKPLWLTWLSLEEMPYFSRESVTIDEIVKVFDERIEMLRGMDEEQEKKQGNLRWKMQVENRQRQSEEANNRLSQIEEAERLEQVERPNNPNPSEEAGPSGQS